LKRSYGYFVGIITGLFLVAGIVIAVATDQKMLDYILKFFVPSLSVFVLGAEASKAHLDVAKSKQQKEKEINAMMELSKKQPGSVTTQECRQLQDYIFSLRCKDALVPNWWYRKLRWRYEMDMQKAAEEIGNEASTSSEKRI